MKKYLRHRVWNVVDVKELITLEYPDFYGKYRGYSERHDFFELCFVERGELSLVLEDGQRNLSQGQIFLIEPGKTHAYFPYGIERCLAFVICFASSSQALRSLSDIPLTVGELEESALHRIIEESRESFYMNDSDELVVRESAQFGGQQAILLQLEYLLICLLRRLAGKKGEIVFLSGERFYADLTGVIMDFFRENIRENLTLKLLCEKMHYSQSFLCKSFKEQTGKTLIGCFNEMKIEEAKRLLSEGDKSVKDVSAYLGFSEAKYFGAQFKRLVGLSPTEYKIRVNNKKGNKL